MFIATEQTPNPATLKFLPGQDVLGTGTAEFTEAGEAEAGSPLAHRLFAVEGVKSVYLGADFVSVTKSEGVDWYMLKPAVLGAVMQHFISGDPAINSAAVAAESTLDESDPLIRQIRELIDTRVRPAVARDGGDITLQGFDRGIVYLNMRGACSGCPSSTMTLKSGIENLLKYYVPEVVEVRAVGA